MAGTPKTARSIAQADPAHDAKEDVFYASSPNPPPSNASGILQTQQDPREKPDLKLSACVWRGPYASCAVKEEDKTTEIFELTEDGRLAAVEWIRQQYESRLDYWEAAPSIKDAVPIVHE